jgi:hypothetical protein
MRSLELFVPQLNNSSPHLSLPSMEDWVYVFNEETDFAPRASVRTHFGPAVLIPPRAPDGRSAHPGFCGTEENANDVLMLRKQLWPAGCPHPDCFWFPWGNMGQDLRALPWPRHLCLTPPGADRVQIGALALHAL